MNTTKDNFEPLFRTSPFLDLIGPIYQFKKDKELIIGLQIEEKHCNARQSLHGGVISTLADIALGYNTAFSGDKPVPLATANLSIDLAFANCYFIVKEKKIARASAVFSVLTG